jgi:hypothetical protein
MKLRILICAFLFIPFAVAPSAPTAASIANPAARHLETHGTGGIAEVAVRRGGAAFHRGGAVVGPRGGVAVRRSGEVVRPGWHGGGVRKPPVARPGWHGGGVRWARPSGYWWRPGTAVAAGAAIGFVSAATAVAWAGAAPAPNMCWYYTDPSRTQGFWDACP